MDTRFALVVLATVAAGSSGGALLAAEPQRFELGLRGILTAADGTPANDIPGYGLYGRLRLGERWSLGAAVDRAEYDVEQPARLLGLAQDPSVEVIDALAESTTVSVWLERALVRGARTAWYLGPGIAIATIDVPDAAGPLRGGGTFLVRTDAETETLAFVVVGLRRDLGTRWRLDLGLRVERHFADWRVEDRVSGRQARIDDYTTHGGHLGLSWRFR